MKIKLYKGKFGYSIYCSNKKLNAKCYMNVYFKQGCEPQGDQVEIDVIDGNFSCREEKDKVMSKIMPTLWINEYKLLDSAEKIQVTKDENNFTFSDIKPDELPFY